MKGAVAGQQPAGGLLAKSALRDGGGIVDLHADDSVAVHCVEHVEVRLAAKKVPRVKHQAAGVATGGSNDVARNAKGRNHGEWHELQLYVRAEACCAVTDARERLSQVRHGNI